MQGWYATGETWTKDPFWNYMMWQENHTSMFLATSALTFLWEKVRIWNIANFDEAPKFLKSVNYCSNYVWISLLDLKHHLWYTYWDFIIWLGINSFNWDFSKYFFRKAELHSSKERLGKIFQNQGINLGYEFTFTVACVRLI